MIRWIVEAVVCAVHWHKSLVEVDSDSNEKIDGISFSFPGPVLHGPAVVCSRTVKVSR